MPELTAPIALAAFAVFSTFQVHEASRPSAGCKHAAVTNAGAMETKLVEKHIQIADFEQVQRTFWVQAPPKASQPAPLLIGFHGQTSEASSFGDSHTFGTVGKEHNLMSVFPQGMDDIYPGEDQGTGWNVGSAGDNATCVPAGVGTEYGCYKSCRALKKCGRCNWSTCYNDVLFIKTMIEAVAQEFCVDLDRIYAQGESNGAMLLQHLVRSLPSTFAGIAPWFGTPMLGYLLGDHRQMIRERRPLQRTAYLSLHARSDTTIPAVGGVSEDGWIYEPLDQSTALWADIHGCSSPATPLVTQWDGGPLNFRCSEYTSCSTGRRVVQCMYDGVHGDWPTGTDGDQITMWFLLQFDRSSSPSASLVV